MSTVDWLQGYDATLFAEITRYMGTQPPPYFDDEILTKLSTVGVKGFYFNSVDAGQETAPAWLPENHRLATMVIEGSVSRSSTSLTNSIYKRALDGVAVGGSMHTILYFKDCAVELQSLFSLGTLNKHRAMGSQAIIGSPTTGFLKAVTDFVARFANRDDIFQIDIGTWNDGLKAIETYVGKSTVMKA